ncbi:MAG: hypothetical protein AABW88_03175 [Nanoarchaeota archaeon]
MSAQATPKTITITRLYTGEMLLSKTEKHPNGDLTLHKPLLIIVSQDQETGQIQVGLNPYLMMLKKEEMTIARSGYLYSEDTDETTQANYRRLTGDIIVPPSGLILPGQ